MSEKAAYSQSEWARRRAQADAQARGGGTAVAGVLLSVVGVVLGAVVAFQRDVLEGSAIVVISAMLGILILLVGSVLDAGGHQK